MVMGRVALAGGLALSIVAGSASAGSDAMQNSPADRAGTSGWAVVNANGRLMRGMNVVRVKHTDVGKYVVEFNSDVSNCAYSATIGGVVGHEFPGSIVVSNHSKSGERVHVSTFENNVHQQADYRFHLIVQC